VTARLRNLLTVVGVVVIGGATAYLVVTPKPGINRAELLDAGIADHCRPAHIEAQVRINDVCRDLPDGGMRRRFATVETKGYLCDRDAGPDAIVIRWPRQQGEDCFELLSETAVRIIGDAGACVDSAVCDDTSGPPTPRAGLDRCACRRPDAGPCRTPNPDGGTAINEGAGYTIFPPFVGAGCFRKPCHELDGYQGESWPSECPR
jgi:hypothetical protein